MNKSNRSIPLHSGWQVFSERHKRWIPARVPGCIHTDLLAAGLIPDPFYGDHEKSLQWIEEADWTYKLVWEAGDIATAYDHIDLVAEGLDTFASITLNGHSLGTSDNMFVAHEWPVQKLLQPSTNELIVKFSSPMAVIRQRQSPDDYREWLDPVGGCSHVRKAQYSFGWDWGPRFVTCGIYRPLLLRCWNQARIEHIAIRQHHQADGSVRLKITPSILGPTNALRLRHQLRIDGQEVATTEGAVQSSEISVPAPQLWWPAGQGDQPLYELEIQLVHNGQIMDQLTKHIGLRTIELDRHPDDFGESFQFKVNGRAIFAKGSNWIPAHSFLNEARAESIHDLLRSAVRAHHNMVRVWGGGVYETTEFYDTCDRLGLLVWQDFMFACALYPGTPEFIESVRREATYQVKRLAHHASLALWCGNNEIEYIGKSILDFPERRRAYEAIFYELLPSIVKNYDGVTDYWPSSPHNPAGMEHGAQSPTAGDCHSWEVWHARQPIKSYEDMKFRFLSEFGMQSFSSPWLASTFCDPGRFDILGSAMENHQKSPQGNQIILDYLSRRFPFPHGYAEVAFLSQINQAYAIQVAVEHFRRSIPRTMGALYWQLNDCWPGFSWSSLEFGGKWKALHFAAARFFAPLLVSGQVIGTESVGRINNRINQVSEVHLYTVFDDPRPDDGRLEWIALRLDGTEVARSARDIPLTPGTANRWEQIDVRAWLTEFGAENLVIRLRCHSSRGLQSDNTVLLTAPRFMHFSNAPLQCRVIERQEATLRVELTSPVFHHAVWLDSPAYRVDASDNGFDLYPNVPQRVDLTLPADADPSALNWISVNRIGCGGGFLPLITQSL